MPTETPPCGITGLPGKGLGGVVSSVENGALIPGENDAGGPRFIWH